MKAFSKSILVLVVSLISISAVVAPQGHILPDILAGSYAYQFGGLITLKTAEFQSITAVDITASNAGSITRLGIGQAADTNALSVTGSAAILGTLDMKDNKIRNVNGPDGVASEVATKNYVDEKILSDQPWTKSGSSVYYLDGNVAIGTTSPAANLHVFNGAGQGSVVIEGSETNGNAASLMLRDSDVNHHWLIQKTDNSLGGTSDDLNFIYFNGATNIPAMNLKPTGDAFFSKDVNVAGDVTVSGKIKGTASTGIFTEGAHSEWYTDTDMNSGAWRRTEITDEAGNPVNDCASYVRGWTLGGRAFPLITSCSISRESGKVYITPIIRSRDVVNNLVESGIDCGYICW